MSRHYDRPADPAAVQAKMKMLDLSVAEICAAIENLPVQADWRNIDSVARNDEFSAVRAIWDAMEKRLLCTAPCTIDLAHAAYAYKCTPEEAARSLEDTDIGGRTRDLVDKHLTEKFDDRPHNPDTMEMTFDDHEKP